MDPVVGQAKEAEEEILLPEAESDPVETLTTIVTGCENFVTATIVGIQGEVHMLSEMLDPFGLLLINYI